MGNHDVLFLLLHAMQAVLTHRLFAATPAAESLLPFRCFELVDDLELDSAELSISRGVLRSESSSCFVPLAISSEVEQSSLIRMVLVPVISDIVANPASERIALGKGQTTPSHISTCGHNPVPQSSIDKSSQLRAMKLDRGRPSQSTLSSMVQPSRTARPQEARQLPLIGSS